MRALIRFGKQPRLRFISHLDLQRFFQRLLAGDIEMVCRFIENYKFSFVGKCNCYHKLHFHTL